jgi:hypothetical protein
MMAMPPRLPVRVQEVDLDAQLQQIARQILGEWWHIHREDLAENWRLANELRELKRIPPLE